MIFRAWFYVWKLALAGIAVACLGFGFAISTDWGRWIVLVGQGMFILAAGTAGLLLLAGLAAGPPRCPFCSAPALRQTLFGKRLMLVCRACGLVHGDVLMDLTLRLDPNLTQQWQRDPHLSVQFDMDRHALCGAALGEPLQRLSALGPADNGGVGEAWRPFEPGVYAWHTLGVAAETDEEQRLVCFTLYWRNDDERSPYRPFAGQCLLHGQSAPLSHLTSEESVRRLLGEPYGRDEDEDEILLFYEFPGAEWQVEFTPEGRLSVLLATLEPLLADEQQRAAYGIEAPWPAAPAEQDRDG